MELLAPSGVSLSASDLADWAEVSALRLGKTFKRGDLKSAVDGVESGGERLVEGAWTELSRRFELLGESWPFQLNASRLVRRDVLSDDQRLIFEYLAVISYSSLTSVDRLLFERIVLAMVQYRFAGAAYRIGHPAIPSIPSSLVRRIRLYQLFAGLKDLELGKPPLPADKDLGMDVISWYPFADARGGNVHFLLQCATGRDWYEKDLDINLTTIREHVSWGSEPVRVLCIPRSVTMEEARWLRVGRSAGSILDRTRIVREFRGVELSVGLRDDIMQRFGDLTEV
jgi:hypothetical protein